MRRKRYLFENQGCGSKTLLLIKELPDIFEAQCKVCRKKVTIKKIRFSRKEVTKIREVFLDA